MKWLGIKLILVLVTIHSNAFSYENILIKAEPLSVFEDYPEFLYPIKNQPTYSAPPLIKDKAWSIYIKAWRYSYNLRAIIEVPFFLDNKKTAIIVVHPWGIDDGQGLATTHQSCAFFCTPEKNKIAALHAQIVLDPFLKKWRPQIRAIVYSLTKGPDPIRTKLYTTFLGSPSKKERDNARKQLQSMITSFKIPDNFPPQSFPATTTREYFQQFPSLVHDNSANGLGFWDLPIPITKAIEIHDSDIVFFDDQGYLFLKNNLKNLGIEHILICGYCTDMCLMYTSAGYQNLSKDFNVIIVGDATLATFPADNSPAKATTTSLQKASLSNFITQISFISN